MENEYHVFFLVYFLEHSVSFDLHKCVYVHIKPDKLSFTILYLDKLIPPTDILNRKRKTLGVFRRSRRHS